MSPSPYRRGRTVRRGTSRLAHGFPGKELQLVDRMISGSSSSSLGDGASLSSEPAPGRSRPSPPSGSRRPCRGSRRREPLLLRPDEQREVLRHEAGLDRVDADLLQRRGEASRARRCRRAWRDARGRASRRRSRRSSWSRSPGPSDARGSGASPCRARPRPRRSAPSGVISTLVIRPSEPKPCATVSDCTSPS